MLEVIKRCGGRGFNGHLRKEFLWGGARSNHVKAAYKKGGRGLERRFSARVRSFPVYLVIENVYFDENVLPARGDWIVSSVY